MNRTAQREAILCELRMLKTHPSADELYDALRKKMPQISLGTVYRNLEQMSNVGLVRKLSLSGRQKRFDGDLVPHYHLRCSVCDRVRDISPELFAQVESGIAELLPEIGATSYYFEFIGDCPDCSGGAKR